MFLDKTVHIPDLGDVTPDSGFHVLESTEDGRFTVGENGETLKACWADMVLCSDCCDIDYVNGIVYLSQQGNITPVMFSLKNADCAISIHQDPKARTGAVIDVLRNGKVYESYTVVLYGDADCDGFIDARDSVIINCIANGLLGRTDIGNCEYLAADCVHNGEINQDDVCFAERKGLSPG